MKLVEHIKLTLTQSGLAVGPKGDSAYIAYEKYCIENNIVPISEAEYILAPAQAKIEAENAAAKAAEAETATTNANEAAANADEKAGQAAEATQNAVGATEFALEIANHPTYIGTDHYVYEWNPVTKAYDKTEIYVKGDAFSIAKTYLSVAAMEADFEGTDTKPGDFVLIESGDVDDPDNSKLYVKGSTGWGYLTDLSGAIGFTGKTPQFSIGTVLTGEAGSSASVSISEDGIDANGNPKYLINFAIPKGDKGDKGDTGEKGDTGKNTYQYYFDNTTDDPKLTEAEWTTIQAQMPANELLRQQQEAARVQAEIDRVNSGAALVVDVKAIQPAVAFLKRITADGGTCADKSLLAKFYTEMNQSLANTHALYFFQLGIKERVSGINRFCNKAYDMGPLNNDGVMATEATQSFVGGYIAPNEFRCLKYLQGQTQTGEITIPTKSYLATDSWTLTVMVKPNTESIIWLSATTFIYISNTTLYIKDGSILVLQATIPSGNIGKIAHIEFQYSNGTGVIKYNGTPLATSVLSNTIYITRISRATNIFDGSIYYFHLENVRISEADSQKRYNFLRSLFAEIEGIGIGNQFWQTSNIEQTVAGNGEVIAEIQSSTNTIKLQDGTWDFTNWTPQAGVTISNANTFSANINVGIFKNISLVAGRMNKIIIAGTVTGAQLAIRDTSGTSGQQVVSGTFDTVLYYRGISSTNIYLGAVFGNITSCVITKLQVEEQGWADLTTPAWCYYNNNVALGAVYGKLYNWYAIDLINKYAPQGYRAPSSADFTQLATFLGGTSVAGGKMKKEGLTYWTTPNTGATNESGLSIIAGGYRTPSGAFTRINRYGTLWGVTSPSDSPDLVITEESNSVTITANDNKIQGFNLRYIRTSPVGENRRQIESGFFTTDIASVAKSINVPHGYVITQIRITTTTNVTSIEAKLFNTAGSAVATLITGKACNATSIVFDVAVDQPTQPTDFTVKTTAVGNSTAGVIGMNITVICEKIQI